MEGEGASHSPASECPSVPEPSVVNGPTVATSEPERAEQLPPKPLEVDRELAAMAEELGVPTSLLQTLRIADCRTLAWGLEEDEAFEEGGEALAALRRRALFLCEGRVVARSRAELADQSRTPVRGVAVPTPAPQPTPFLQRRFDKARQGSEFRLVPTAEAVEAAAPPQPRRRALGNLPLH